MKLMIVTLVIMMTTIVTLVIILNNANKNNERLSYKNCIYRDYYNVTEELIENSNTSHIWYTIKDEYEYTRDKIKSFN